MSYLRPLCSQIVTVFGVTFVAVGANTYNACLAATVEETKAAVRTAFLAVHDGWSADEVLLNDERNAAFVAACRETLPDGDVAEVNWQLLNLRKARQLPGRVTKQLRIDHTAYRHLAEIIARVMTDKHRLTIDRMLCDPMLRAEFNEQARRLAPDVDPYHMRKAAFGLRKARQLRPELVVRIADWGRRIEEHSVAACLARLAGGEAVSIPEQPGIYIFRDKTGYLYVGEAKNLRTRLLKHLDRSDRQSLATYLDEHGQLDDVMIELHVFAKDSRVREVSIRRAYESELIASRKPRLNIQP